MATKLDTVGEPQSFSLGLLFNYVRAPPALFTSRWPTISTMVSMQVLFLAATVLLRTDGFCLSPLSTRPLLTCLSTSTKPAAITETSKRDVVTFVTPAMPMYIEDTDAYGVMYHSNHVKAYDRALHLTSMDQTTGTSVLQHDGWSIISIERMLFQSPPVLGGALVIEGTLREQTDSEEVWDMVMKGSETGNVHSTAIGVTIARPPPNGEALSSSWLPTPPPLEDSDGLTLSYQFQTFRDEFDTQLQSHMPIRNMMNLFERTRTNWIGGPHKLHQLQHEGVMLVVTGMRNCSLVALENHAMQCIPGQSVTVTTLYVAKRRGMAVECAHTAYLGDKRIAQGIVTMVTLNAATMRPTKNLPVWMKKKIHAIKSV